MKLSKKNEYCDFEGISTKPTASLVLGRGVLPVDGHTVKPVLLPPGLAGSFSAEAHAAGCAD